MVVLGTIRWHPGPTVQMHLPPLAVHLMLPPMYFKSALIYNFSCPVTIKPHEAASTLEHYIWGDLNIHS